MAISYNHGIIIDSILNIMRRLVGKRYKNIYSIPCNIPIMQFVGGCNTFNGSFHFSLWRNYNSKICMSKPIAAIKYLSIIQQYAMLINRRISQQDASLEQDKVTFLSLKMISMKNNFKQFWCSYIWFMAQTIDWNWWIFYHV